VRVGIALPQFRHEAEPALDVARKAEEAGLGGVFVFDHLWPLGRPDRPALQSHVLLGALIAEGERVTLGTLVSRVGLVPDAVLVHTLTTLHRMSEGRFIAGLGTGDKANRAENEAYGVAFAPAAQRLASVAACSRALRADGVHTWIGGVSAAVLRTAADGHADGWNGWGLSPDDFAALASRLPPTVEPTWGGQVLIGRNREDAQAKRDEYGERPKAVTGTLDDLVRHLRALAGAGATWAVCAPIDVGVDPQAVDVVAEAAEEAR
jgi:alkanesulfonate monooxygenase SsuD/methylene tetrahydromethanopterin reductase-like flavin-dependent oxidoreductase (luciferase family)